MLMAMVGGVRALTGYTIGITGHRRWEEQAELLCRRGARVVHGPVMHTSLLHDTDATLRATHDALSAGPDIVVLSTGIGTRSWFAAAESAGLDDRLRDALSSATVLTRGPKARSAAIAVGLDVAWQAPGETGAEVLAHLRDLGAAGRRVAVQRDGGEPLLAEGVRRLGAEVIDVPVYRWEIPDRSVPARRLIDAACAGRLDAVTFTCAYAVGATFTLAPDPDALCDALNGGVAPVAVGPVCATALRRHGVDHVIEPRRARLGAMVQALVAALRGRQRVLRHGAHERRWQGAALVGDDGRVTGLTPTEVRTLETLVGRGSRSVVPKSTLVGNGVDGHAAEAAVGRLRAKLGPLGAAIRTVPRRGYLCTLEVAGTEG